MDFVVIKEQLELCLQDKNTKHIYFAGGSLCVDLADEVQVLNINGKSSMFLSGTSEEIPDDVLKIVQEIYLKHKGDTEYFKGNAKKLESGVL